MPHTPGPWTIDEDAPRDIVSRDNRFSLVATAYPMDADQNDDDPEAAANARLMAASLEMLEELKRVRDGLFNLCEMGLVRPKEETLAVARRISTLISKVEGK